MSGRLVATCRVCEQTWDVDANPPACSCEDPADDDWTVVLRNGGAGGFGYWAGPRHEAEGGGYSGPPQVSGHKRGLVPGLDRDGYGEIGVYIRRPTHGEW